MASKIRYNKTFIKELSKLAEWLEKRWSKKVAEDFTESLYGKIHRLSSTPFVGSICKKNKKVRKLTINKHNIVYYRVNGRVINIVSLFNTKRNPLKNKYE
jgi:plasmid stabilization system protein ParE